MDFYNEVGTLALGSRMRRLTENITRDATQIYKLYQTNLEPKWFPVFYVLSQGEGKTITEIAREIGHSHPSVSKIAGEMLKRGVVEEQTGIKDGRRNVIGLSPMGKDIATKIQDQYTDVSRAIAEISANATHDLWKAIDEWEYLLEQKTFVRRVQEQKKIREGNAVKIVDYSSRYQKAFKALNEEWISTYFRMEETDYKALDNPRAYILNKGGYIIIALYGDEPVGVCALLKMNDPEYDFELAKMAVSPKVQGKNIGWRLGQAIIEKAKSAGAKKLYLESNTILKPAIGLYHKLGFVKVAGHPTPYKRCNIQMELVLK